MYHNDKKFSPYACFPLRFSLMWSCLLFAVKLSFLTSLLLELTYSRIQYYACNVFL